MKNKENKAKKEKPSKSFSETIALMLRKKWLTNTTQTLLIVLILLAAFVAINVLAQKLDLPEIDVTANKIYTLSDSSKSVIAKINKDVHIYIYGFDEDNTLVDFVKQYAKTNDHITYEILTEESNLAKVQEFELASGYQIVVLETDTSKKIIDASYEFYSYDYETGQEVDLTEQSLTNSLLAITSDNKPKVYFTTGHEEYALGTDLGVLSTYLVNESYEPNEVNLVTTGAVPEDCNLLVIMAPVKDFVESEVDAVLAYINKGGNIIITTDVGNLNESYTNLNRIYDAYGVTMENKGYVYETDTQKTAANSPNVFIPGMSPSSNITADIYSGRGQIWLIYAGRLTFKSDEELASLNITRDDLLTSSEEALFVTDLTSAAENLADVSEKGKSVIASLVTKTINSEEEGAEPLQSQAVIMANASFITDYSVEQLSSSYPMSYLGNNKDFMLNSVAELTAKEDTLKIRKDMSNSTYEPTQEQHTIVLIIIFAVPITIILIGVLVWNHRRRKK